MNTIDRITFDPVLQDWQANSQPTRKYRLFASKI